MLYCSNDTNTQILWLIKVMLPPSDIYPKLHHNNHRQTAPIEHTHETLFTL